MPVVKAGEMPDIDEELVEYVAEYLAELPEGFGGVGANARNMSGGVNAWVAEGLPLVS